MSWFQKLSNRSVMFTWLLSYILILLVPLTMGVILFFYSESTVQKQMLRYNEVLSENMLSKNDNRILDNIEIAASVSLDETIQSAFRIDAPLLQEEQKALYELKGRIADFHVKYYNNQNSLRFFVYLKNVNRVVDDLYVSDTETFYRQNYGEEEAYAKWLSALEGAVPSYFQTKEKNNGRRICYATPFFYNGQFRGSFVIERSLPVLVESVSDYVGGMFSAEYVILTGADDLFAASPALAEMDIEEAKELFYQGKQKISINGHSYYASVKSSTATGFKYLIAVSDPESGKGLQALRIIGILLIGISALGGLVLIFFLLKQNYAPVRSVMDEISISASNIGMKSGNEWTAIRDTVFDVLRENTNISRRLDNQSQELKTHLLYEMLLGQSDVMSLSDDRLRECGIDFPGRSFAVALFYIEDYEKLFEEDKESNDTVKFRTVSFILRNVVEDMLQKEDVRGYVTNVNGILALLVSFSDYGQTAREQEKMLYDTIAEIKRFIEENLFIYFTVSLSNITYDITGIEYAYRQALTAMEYKFSMGAQLIITQKDVSVSVKNEYAYTEEKERMLINYIKTADFSGASALIETVFSERDMTLDMLKCLTYDMAGTIFRIIGEEKREQYKELSERLFHFETMEEFKETIFTVTRELCEQHQTQKGDILCAKVMKLVEENYNDPDLSVSRIADYLGIQYAYLSVAFKNYKGEGILDYISRTRVNISKELLRDPLLSIDEVGKRVGYATNTTFVRTFKKLEGVTPAKFREHSISQTIR